MHRNIKEACAYIILINDCGNYRRRLIDSKPIKDKKKLYRILKHNNKKQIRLYIIICMLVLLETMPIFHRQRIIVRQKRRYV